MTTTSTPNAATIIASQLGGTRRLSVMIGAKYFAHDNNGTTLSFRFAGCSKMNHVKITLNSMDLYDIEFIKVRRATAKVPFSTVKTIEGVYAEDLIRIFESATKLYLTF